VASLKNPDLFLDAAVVAAVILMAPAGGENGAAGVGFEELGDGADAVFRVGKVVETELEKSLAGVVFLCSFTDECGRIREAQGDTDPGQRVGRSHRVP
jgi:hypothetical protein